MGSKRNPARSAAHPSQSKKLQKAKSMRNILAHEYGIVDDRIVFLAVTEEIEGDIREFLKSIDDHLQKKEDLKEK